jgi:hypothetical protein
MSLFFAGILLVIFWLSRRSQPLIRSPRILLLAALFAYGMPAAFFLYWTLAAPEDATRLRVALLGVGFRTAPDKDLSINVGGDRAKHEIWEDDLPTKAADNSITVGKLELHPGSSLSLLGPEPNPVGILAQRASDRSLLLPNAIELQHGDLISFNGYTWQVRFEHGLLDIMPPQIYFYNEAQTNVLPLQRSEIPIVKWKLPIWRAFPVSRQTYPLDKLLQIGQAGSSDGLTGFFYRNKNRLFLAALKQGISLERAGKPLIIKPVWDIAQGTRLHVLGLPRWTGTTDKAGGVRDLRSFRVFPGQKSLMLVYDSPEIHTLAQRDLQELRMQTGESQEHASFRVALSMGYWHITDKYLYLRQVSGLVGSEAFAILELPKTWETGFKDWQEPLILTAPGGQQNINNGEPAWLGEKNLAAIQIDLLKPPVFLAFLTLLLVLVKALVATTARISALHLIVAGAIEIFVLFRVLLGYRVWIMPPFEDEAMKLALTAWAFLPWAFLYASQPSNFKEQSFWLRLPAFLGLVFSAIWCFHINGGGLKSLVWVGFHILVLALPYLHSPAQRRKKRSKSKSSSAMAKVSLGTQVIARFWPKNPWSRWALLLFIVRLIFLFIGARESLPIGGVRFSLSILHIPAALFIEAGYLVWLWRQLEQKGLSRPAELWGPFIAIGAFVWFLPALFTSDFGLFLLNFPLFVIVSGLLIFKKLTETVQRRQEAGKRIFYKGFVAVCLFIMVVLFVPRLLPIGSLLNDTENMSERNYLRFLQFVYPEKLPEIATRSSEDLVQMIRVMDTYTSGPLAGRGYTQSELSLKSTALREHTLAVFIVGEWGTLGVIGLMLVYMVVAFAGLTLLPWYRGDLGRTEESTDRIGAFVGLTSFTFAFSSIYIILATYNLLPFTGKNLYLFGLDSGSDIIESSVLLVIIALGAAMIKDKETTW